MSSSKHSPHLIMPFPLSIHAQEKQRARTGLVVLASTFLAAVALLAFLNEYSEPALQIDALELKDGFTVAQIGQYGMRADRQARNFELGDLPQALQHLFVNCVAVLLSILLPILTLPSRPCRR
jgi:hypothetical protein